jgi:hypothetical protein
MFFSDRPKRIGNYKPGPGRPPGRKNNRTLQLEAASREAAASIDGRFEGDAHAFLASIYKNTRLPLELRIQAASRALRVEKPAPLPESPYSGLAAAVEAGRKLARPRALTANSTDDQTLLIDGGKWAYDRSENS